MDMSLVHVQRLLFIIAEKGNFSNFVRYLNYETWAPWEFVQTSRLQMYCDVMFEVSFGPEKTQPSLNRPYWDGGEIKLVQKMR